MKKLGIMLAAVVMLIAFAVPAMASDVSISGEFDYSAITPFDAAKAAEGFGNYYFDMIFDVDEYNEVLIEFWGDLPQGSAANLGYFQLTTDVGSAFDLPIGVKTKAGITSIYSSKFEVSGYAYERAVRPAVDPICFVAALDFDMATLDVGVGYGQGGEANNDIGFLLVLPEVGPATVEAYYMANDNADFKGWVGGNAKADLGMASVAGMFAYDMVDEVWAYGVGASAGVDIATIGVSLNGNDADALNQVGIDVDAKLTDMYGVTGTVGLSFAEADEAFQGADISAYVTPGGATWRVGYIITENNYAYGSNVAVLDGGFYISAGIDF